MHKIQWCMSTRYIKATTRPLMRCGDRSSVSSQGQSVVFLPVATSWRPNHITVSVTFAHTTILSTSRRETTQLTMLMYCLAYPVNSRVSSYCLVLRVHHDDFIVHVRWILAYPVRIQHTESTCQSTGPLLSFRSCSSLKFDLVDTFIPRFTVSCTLRHGSLAATTSQSNSIDDVPLLCSVPKSSGFIRTSRSRSSMYGSQVTQLPASYAKKKTQQIALFLLVKFLKILVCTHLGIWYGT